MSISAISVYYPPTVLSNEELAKIFKDWDSDKVFLKTGIRQRYVVNGETVSDMAVLAAENLFKENNINRDDIDFILLCTQSPDYFLPTTACLVQNRLSLSTECGALDFNLGCSGYVYGLSLAKGLLMGGMATNVLLITSEIYTRYLHPMDRSVRTIFGDAATATLITQKSKESCHWGEFVFGTDGRGASKLIVAANGIYYSCNRTTNAAQANEQSNMRSPENLYMDGPAIFNFTLDLMPDLFDQILFRNNFSREDIDLFVFHQANKFMLTSLREKLGIPEDKFYINIENTGNTVSSTIPIALFQLLKEGKLSKGMNIMLVGFGVGYSWAGCIIRW